MLCVIHTDNSDLYFNDYHNHLLCPECRTAKLSFVPNAKTPYFKTMPHETHPQDCSFNFTSASKKKLETYRDQGKNHADISRKLQALLDILAKCNLSSNNTNTSTTSFNKTSTKLDFTMSTNGKKYYIPRKKLTVPFAKDDYNIPKLFYGTIQLEWKQGSNGSNYLSICFPETNQWIGNLFVSDNVYSHLKDSMKFSEKRVRHIAFFSKLLKKKNFNTFTLKYSSELIIG